MQLSLFDGGLPAFRPVFDNIEHRELEDGAWVDYQPAWLQGHAALMERLIDSVEWRKERRRMYERIVDVPRLTAPAPTEGEVMAIAADAQFKGTFRRDLADSDALHWGEGEVFVDGCVRAGNAAAVGNSMAE